MRSRIERELDLNYDAFDTIRDSTTRPNPLRTISYRTSHPRSISFDATTVHDSRADDTRSEYSVRTSSGEKRKCDELDGCKTLSELQPAVSRAVG